ncbi:peroxidase family protein [Parasphingorhabdus halotolerans]|uniref:Heme peroxidase n=1 Tax=Parasphingorhabdus halotolerans TaxID=2725558 RepID=A0A6H2DM20_9SPHN|nr:peroxidase family protein [Parasphingorhabdus halotolerans]QJB69033.1 heme peroxidase [Parasphingorhabdus halotolerans]
MGSSLEDIALAAGSFVLGGSKLNRILVNKLVKAGRNRPHPWTTKHGYISWSGLTDRTFNARLLPAKPYPADEALGTRRPPIDDVVRLFLADPAGQRECPKSTMLFPAFAQYLTDGFLRTQMSNDPPFGSGEEDRRRTTSNHEIDQSPLYGRTPVQTEVLRTMSEEAGKRGRLKSQSMSGEEYSPFLFGTDGKVKPEFLDADGNAILDLPLGLSSLPPGAPQFANLFAVGGDRVNSTPQVMMMNTLWLREHNRLAGILESKHPDWDDERMFETTRNIIIVMFIKIVVEEYINHINTAKFKFLADPKVAWAADWNRPNLMTTEFSLLYRWHPLVPQSVNWGGQVHDGKSLLLNNSVLINSGLVQSFVDISANHSTALGLHNSASFLLAAEQKAIAQARTNNVATYNDYRRAMGMDPAKSYADLVGTSKEPAERARRAALAAELQRLYGDIENVEFYVGLFAEPSDKNGPLPELILAMVAMDAFSQAFTNPLLSEHVYGNEENRLLAFTKEGLEAINDTDTLRDILERNSTGLGDRFVGMTRRDWKRN